MGKTTDQSKPPMVEDDASRYLDSLTDEERRPKYIRNKLPSGKRGLTKKEAEVAWETFPPND